MRCSQCDMPLSPSRTSCPRCGAVAGNVGVRPSGKIRLTRDSGPAPSNSSVPDNNNNTNQGAPSPAWGVVAPVTFPQEPQADATRTPAQAGQFSPASQPAPYPPQTNAPRPPTFGAQQNMYVPSTPTPSRQTTPQSPRMSMPTPPLQSRSTPPQRPPRIKLGFTVAGMCLMAGALIMVFVFIMAQSLPLTQNTASTDATSQPNNKPATTRPVATQTPTSQPTATQQPTPSATATMPISGGVYVDNASLTNGVDTRTGQPLQPTQIFRLGQSVYVTMTIHQPAYNGAICLSWSVNDRAYPYASSAAPGGATYLPQTSAYFYYKPGSTGPGFVDISWASSIACADKVPVQRLQFTVTA